MRGQKYAISEYRDTNEVYAKLNNVTKVGGAYHGWSDPMVYGLHVPSTGRLEATGIPRGASTATQEFFPNGLGALKRHLVVNRLRGGTAAVIVEPLGPESGTRPVLFDFNQKVREPCDEFVDVHFDGGYRRSDQ